MKHWHVVDSQTGDEDACTTYAAARRALVQCANDWRGDGATVCWHRKGQYYEITPASPCEADRLLALWTCTDTDCGYND